MPTRPCDLGLVTRLVALEDLVPEAVSTARTVSRKGPVAVRLAKLMLAEASGGRASAELERVAYAVSVLHRGPGRGHAGLPRGAAPGLLRRVSDRR